jgi:ABC-type oligopeptide transport system ATPase subunit
MNPVVEITELAVHYTSRHGPPIRAVDGVSFGVEPGETLGLVGESGCGKSTVTNAIVGFVAPTSGSIKVQGIEVAGADARTLYRIRAQAQMVFQDPSPPLIHG